jgi:hypothetical protein
MITVSHVCSLSALSDAPPDSLSATVTCVSCTRPCLPCAPWPHLAPRHHLPCVASRPSLCHHPLFTEIVRHRCGTPSDRSKTCPAPSDSIPVSVGVYVLLFRSPLTFLFFCTCLISDARYIPILETIVMLTMSSPTLRLPSLWELQDVFHQKESLNVSSHG